MVDPSPLTQKLIRSISRLDSRSNISAVVYEYVFASISKRVRFQENISEADKNILIYVAVLEAIFNFDRSSSVRYVLQQDKANDRKKIEHILCSHYFKKTYLFCRTQKLPYLVISDMLESKKSDLKKFFADPAKLEKEVEKIYEKRREKVEEKIYRRIASATLLVFLASFLSFLTLTDFPLSLKVVLFSIPSLLSSLLIFNFSSPPEKDKRRVIFLVMETLYKKKEVSRGITFRKEKRKTAHLLVNTFYAIGFLFMIIIILWCLDVAGLPSFSSAMFVVLLVFISFTGVKTKEILEDIYFTKKKEKIIDVVMDFFAFPIIKTRGWALYRKDRASRSSSPQLISKVPRKPFSVLLEGWVEELRKKKEKIYED